MENKGKYDYYITIVDKDPVLSEHLRDHIQNRVSHNIGKRVCVSIEKSLHDILSMPGAQSLQLCIIEPFDDLKENGFDDATVQKHLAFMKQNNHISFMIYSAFSDPKNRYADESTQYYLKGAQMDDLLHDITEIIAHNNIGKK